MQLRNLYATNKWYMYVQILVKRLKEKTWHFCQLNNMLCLVYVYLAWVQVGSGGYYKTSTTTIAAKDSARERSPARSKIGQGDSGICEGRQRHLEGKFTRFMVYLKTIARKIRALKRHPKRHVTLSNLEAFSHGTNFCTVKFPGRNFLDFKRREAFC